MNMKLSKLVEHMRPSQGISKQENNTKKSLEEKIQVINRQLDTGEKSLALLEEEFQKTKTQLTQGKDEEYIYTLEKDIENVQKQIETIKKENRKLQFEAQGHGKALQKIEMVQESDEKSKAIEVKMKEILLWRKKIIKLQEQMGSFKVEKRSKQEKYEKANEEYEKLMEEVKEYDIGIVEESKGEKKRQFARKVEKEENDLKLRENTYKFNRTQLERALEELITINYRDKDHLEKLENMISDQLETVKELSEKAGVSTESVKSHYLSGFEIGTKNPLGSLSEIYPNDSRSIPSSTKNIGYSIQNKGRQGLYKGLPIYQPTTGKAQSGNQKILVKRLVHGRNESVDMTDKSAVLYGRNDRHKPNEPVDRKGNASVIEYSKKRLSGMSYEPNSRNDKERQEIESKPNIFRKIVKKEEQNKSEEEYIELYQKTTNSEELSDEKRGRNVRDKFDKEEVSMEKTSNRRESPNSPLKLSEKKDSSRHSPQLSLQKEERQRETDLKLPDKLVEIKKEENQTQTKANIQIKENLVLPQTIPTSTKNQASLKEKDDNQKSKGNPLVLGGLALGGGGLTLPGIYQQPNTTKANNTESKFENENNANFNTKEEKKEVVVLNDMNRMNRLRKGVTPTNVFDVNRENENPSTQLNKRESVKNRPQNDVEDIIHSELPESSHEKPFANKGNERKTNLRDWHDDDNLDVVDFGKEKKEEKRSRAHLFNQDEEEDDVFGSNKGNKMANLSKNLDKNYEWINQDKKENNGNKIMNEALDEENRFGDKKAQRLRIGDQKQKSTKVLKFCDGCI